MNLPVRLAIAGLIALALMLVATPAAGQTAPAPIQTTQPSPPPDTDDQAGFFDVGGRISQAINDWFSSLVTAALNPVLDLLGRSVLSTPNFTEQPRVRDLWGVSAGVANSFFVLMVMVAGTILMGHETVQTSYSVKDLAPRLVFGFLASNLSLLVAGQSIGLANGFSLAFLGQGVGPADATNVIAALVVNAVTGGSIVLVLVGLVVAVMALMLLAVYVIRMAMSVVLIAGAPVALACHALPQTEGIALTWWRALGACLGIQVAQSLVLVTALRIFFASDGRSALGLSIGGSLVDLVVVACLMWILLRVPFWASRAVFSGRASSTARLVKSFVVYKVLRRAAAAAL